MTNEIFEAMEKDSKVDIKENDLSNISEMGRKLTEKHKEVSEDLLPNKLRELGVSEFKLDDGTSMSIQQYYSARITPENRDVCFNWLEANGLGDVIKNTVSANFGRGEDIQAEELMLELENKGHSLLQKKWVEPMTLKAVVKEQVEKGNDLPLEAFKVYVGQKIKVKK